MPIKTFKNINWAFQAIWKMIILNIFKWWKKRIEIIYDSYLEKSIKESERLNRSEVLPMDVNNFTFKSTIPVELESFWALSNKKYQLQTESRQSFINR